MERTYTVEGRWPFPVVMLRRDNARAATPKDRRLIDRISGSHTNNGFGLYSPVRVTLTMEAGEPLRGDREGRWMPNERCWASFGWRVVAAGQDFEDVKRIKAQTQRNEAVRQKALAKLTCEEKEVLGLCLVEA